MFNFNPQNPVYTFGFGGKYPEFRKKTKVGLQAKGQGSPAYNPSGNIIEQRVAQSKQKQGWYVKSNQTPSDIFNQYKPREATGMEQMRGRNGYRGLPFGNLSELKLPTYPVAGRNTQRYTSNQTGQRGLERW